MGYEKFDFPKIVSEWFGNALGFPEDSRTSFWNYRTQFWLCVEEVRRVMDNNVTVSFLQISCE